MCAFTRLPIARTESIAPPDFICVRKRIHETFLRSLDPIDRSSGNILAKRKVKRDRSFGIALTIVLNPDDSILPGIDQPSNSVINIYWKFLWCTRTRFLIFRPGIEKMEFLPAGPVRY